MLAALLNDSRAWTHAVELWLWVSRHAPDGDLGAMPDVAIAAVAGWRGDAGSFVNALRTAGFLDDTHLHGWEEHNGAHKRKQSADKARNERKKSESQVKENTDTSDSLVNHQNVGSVESIEYRDKKDTDKNLALFENQKAAGRDGEPLKRRGRPPKDRSPEAEAERQRERDDADRWIAKARELIGLTAEQAPWASATFMTFRQARKKRGINQLMQALDGLTGDAWASKQGLSTLLSATLIEKGLAAGKKTKFSNTGINAEWERYFAEHGEEDVGA